MRILLFPRSFPASGTGGWQTFSALVYYVAGLLGLWVIQDDLSRAQHYRALAKQLRDSASGEADEGCRKELMELADQYTRLADNLIGRRVGPRDVLTRV